ncbi:MAG TPA: hypothetical protein PK711_03345 [Bacteroidales bacterium]|nr:hypothetical protein [Bacteroidales bacterium]
MIKIVHDFFIPEPDLYNTKVFQDIRSFPVPFFLIRGMMYLTIKFNDKHYLVAEKIDDKFTDGVLSSESKAQELFISELYPKNFFGRGQFPAEISCNL